MRDIDVGEYYPGTPPYPELGEYNYYSGGHELRLFYRRPSFFEMEDVRHGQAEFGFVVEGPIIFFVYRFGAHNPWSDALYSWHLAPERDRALPEADALPESRALLTTVLVDGEKVFSDSSEILSYLREEYETGPEELKLHQRELSPTIYGTSPFAINETLARLREALQEADVEIIDELDLSSLLDGERTYKVLLAADREFLHLAAGANLGAATLALLKVAV